MTLETKTLDLLPQAVEILESGFNDLPDFTPAVELDSMRKVLNEVALLMKDNYPYHHPYYIGQMMKPPHPIARLAYMLSLWINPNNHALDGGRASSAMEKEAVVQIAGMFGWDSCLGHLCSGGTMANLEALWISRCLKPNEKILASQQAHYTHSRICGVLNIPFESIPVDGRARMKVSAIKDALDRGNVGTIVVTVGTTATGSLDPLPEILELQKTYGFRIHADSAYGGYFVLANNLSPESRSVYDTLGEVDSIVIDPHKHGLQPYGCGCVIFKDPSVGIFYKHDSPYTYFTSSELHLGEISLECSRPGSSAVALWATQQLLPMVKGGAFAGSLENCRKAALDFFDRINSDPRFLTGLRPELDIIVWTMNAGMASEASRLTDAVFEAAALANLHLAKANLPRDLFEEYWDNLVWDQDYVTCLRSVLMKQDSLDWMDKIWDTLSRTVDKVLS
ncbi:MAG: aminotransferase class I/II-fold pyridoxal phosphate-dependent enzyme [Deltaproteobacteria bacterium]|nr:aminotransferase class I/II-fold pyridoxal phosphate-dependent enzyme [Deltaproteobacteria bacterium]